MRFVKITPPLFLAYAALFLSPLSLAAPIDSMDEAKASRVQDLFLKAKPSADDKKLSGGNISLVALKVGDKTIQTNYLFVDPQKGLIVGVPQSGDSKTLKPLSFDSRSRTLKANGETLDEKTHKNFSQLKSELTLYLLVRHADDREAHAVLKDLTGLNLSDASLDSRSSGASVDSQEAPANKGAKTSKESHDEILQFLQNGLGNTAGKRPTTSQASLRTKSKAIQDYLNSPDSWTGECGLDGICVYKKGNNQFSLEKGEKETVDALVNLVKNKKESSQSLVRGSSAKKTTEEAGNPASPKAPEVYSSRQEEWNAKLVRTNNEAGLIARLNDLPESQTEAKVYVGAEWCGPCQQKKREMLNNNRVMPDLIIFHPDRTPNPLLSQAGTIPKIFTYQKQNGVWTRVGMASP